MTLIDTHAHIEGEEFNSDRSEVYERALQAGVQGWINISNGVDSLKRSLDLAEKFDSIYVSIGLHPHDAKDVEQKDLDLLAAKVNHPKVVAIGETGLDYFYENSPKEEQKKLLLYFLNLAKQTKLPLSIHLRDAEEDFLKLVDSVFKEPIKGVIHCFTSTWDFAQECLKRGFLISFSGIVTFKKAIDLQEVAKKIPLDKLLVETDAPFLTPEPFRGKRNEPAFVVKTAEKIAALKNISLDELAKATTQNAKALFGLK